MVAPHGVYRCAGEDQWVAIAVTSEAMWAGLMSQPGLTHLREDPRFASMHARVRNREALDAEIAIWTSGQLRHELADALQRVGVDAAAVHNNKEVLLDPHFRARCVFTMIDHTGVGPSPLCPECAALDRRHARPA